MRKTLEVLLLLLFVWSVQTAFPQKNAPAFEQKYREAEVLENNAIYDIAKNYYFDALVLARNSKQHRNIQNKIKRKILSMDCYAQFHHLLRQSETLERMQNFEAAEKYFSDAIQYALDEGLDIKSIDSLRNRVSVISQTKQLCEMLGTVNSLNQSRKYEEAQTLFSEMTLKSQELHDYWQRFSFQDDFVRQFDSLRGFLDFNRNVSKKYRDFFSYDFAKADNLFLDMIDKVAFKQGETFESDISFRFSIDTNGVENRRILCSHDESFADTLFAAMGTVKFTQPYRYGFSLPIEDAMHHHIVSTKKDVIVKKKKDVVISDDTEFDEAFSARLEEAMSSAPDGAYRFVFHRNEIDGRHSLHAELHSAKGGKARKWAKANTVSF